MHDEELTPAERQALDALPEEREPPPELEDRVVRALRASGHLTVGPSSAAGQFGATSRARWLTRAAAAVVLIAIGLTAGRLSAPGGPIGPATGDRPSAGSETTAYLLLLYGDPGGSAADEAARVAEYAAWAGAQAQAGRLMAAEKLEDTGFVLGPTPTAGSVTSQPAGLFLIRAASVDDALAVARDCPHLRHGGTVVVRPVAPNG